MRGLVVVVVAMLGCAPARKPCTLHYAPSVVAGRPFLWEARGPKGSVVLFGTYHASSVDDVPRAAWGALERSNVFVAETDEVENPADAEEFLVLPPGVLLQRLLGDDAFFALAERVEGEVPVERLRHLKPWVAMMLLVKAVFEFPSTNISAGLLAKARERQMRVEFFDRLIDQADFLDASAGTIKLRDAIRKADSLHCGMHYRVDAYRAGDDAVFSSDIPDGGDPIVPRLARWYAQVEQYLERGDHAFIAIGTANLLGPYGLLTTLQANGYDVRRL